MANNIIEESIEGFDFEGTYKYYLLIAFGNRSCVKYFEVVTDKNNAIDKYKYMFYKKQMSEKDFRGINLFSNFAINGLLCGFNNDWGILCLIGYMNNYCFEEFHIGFSTKSYNKCIFISQGELDETLIKFSKKIKIRKDELLKLKN